MCFLLSLALFTLTFVVLFLGTIGLILNLEIGSQIFYFSLLMGLLPVVILTRTKQGHQSFNRRFLMRLSVLSVYLLLVYSSIQIAARTYDISWDGNSIHKPGIVRIVEEPEGYLGTANEPLLERDSTPSKMEQATNYLPKAHWILGSIIYRTTGQIESVEAFNFIVALAAFCYAASVLLKTFQNVNPALLIVTCVTLCLLNPTQVTQYLTSNSEGLLFSSLLAIAVFFFKTHLTRISPTGISNEFAKGWQKESIDSSPGYGDIFVFMVASVLVVNLTLYGLPVVIGLTLAFYVFRRVLMRECASSAERDRESLNVKRTWLAIPIVMVLGLGIIGCNPYLSSIAGGRFKELQESNDTLAVNAGGILWHKSLHEREGGNNNGITKLLRDLFSLTNLIPARERVSLGPHEFIEFNSLTEPDLKLSKFLPFFGVSILLSVALLWMVVRYRKPVEENKGQFLFPVMVIVSFVAILATYPHYWLPLFTDFWGLTFAILLYSMNVGSLEKPRYEIARQFLIYAMVFLLFETSFVYFVRVLFFNIERAERLNGHIQQIKQKNLACGSQTTTDTPSRNELKKCGLEVTLTLGQFKTLSKIFEENDISPKLTDGDSCGFPFGVITYEGESPAAAYINRNKSYQSLPDAFYSKEQVLHFGRVVGPVESDDARKFLEQLSVEEQKRYTQISCLCKEGDSYVERCEDGASPCEQMLVMHKSFFYLKFAKDAHNVIYSSPLYTMTRLCRINFNFEKQELFELIPPASLYMNALTRR